MLTLATACRVSERQVTGECRLTDGRTLTLRLHVRAETPGECCVGIASSLRFDYEPPLAADIAVRFDDRLYDGLYAGLAALAGPMPPEHLKVEVVALASDPALAIFVAGEDWSVIGQIGAALEALAAEAAGLAVGDLIEAGN